MAAKRKLQPVRTRPRSQAVQRLEFGPLHVDERPAGGPVNPIEGAPLRATPRFTVHYTKETSHG